ncbi:MAG TPA: BTAD domain-containing putative transcriptional regulator [Pseudonocardiaceae bacterium]|nr:BTAD domain-containing putative transcriptional regulator [Pseudonocardiaceae bacterium]
MDEAFTILGRTRVRIAGRLKNNSSRPGKILAALLAQPGKQLSFNTLIDWAWADEEERPQNTKQTFHTNSARIRAILGKLDVSAELIAENGALQLVVDRLLIDYHRFRKMIDQARSINEQGEPRRARDLVLKAMELWTGPPLADLRASVAERWRRNAMQNHWIPANGLLVQLHLALGEPERAIARLDDILEDDPGNIRLGKQRSQALQQLGRHADADAHYFSMRRRLLADADDAAAEDLRRFHEDLRRAGVKRVEPSSEPSEKDRVPAVLGLPHATADFVGRDQLLAQLDGIAVDEDGQLRATVVCLDGISGVGKTSLVAYWARRRHTAHGDEVIFVDLHGYDSGRVSDLDSAVDELLYVLGFPVDRIDSANGRAAKLRELLAGRRIIVVLDNVHDSTTVLPLLRLLSSALVLITTSRRLTEVDAHYGARSLTVEPLPAEHAIELLTRRIGERATNESDAVARLAELCGGLPMMLILVAHHVAPKLGVPLGEFADHFRNLEVLLRLGDGSNSSLLKAFSGIYLDLSAVERRTFRQLGLHPGPDISLPAAAALTGLPVEECRHALDALGAANLVEQRVSLDRFRMHDLLRAYASLLAAEDDDRATAMRRLIDFYLFSAHRASQQVFAHRKGIPMPPVPDDVVPMRFHDERGAADWCLAERQNLTAAALYASQNGYESQAVMYPHAFSGIFKRHGFRRDVEEALGRAVVAARKIHDAEAEGATLNDIGLLALEAGEIEVARKNFYLATYLAQSVNSARGEASSLCNMARLDTMAGDIDSGIEHYQTVLRMATDSGHVHLQASVTRRLADVFRNRREYGKAINNYQSALWMDESIGHRDGQVETMVGLSMTYLLRDSHDDCAVAEDYARQAVELIPPVVDPDLERRARLVYAQVLLRVARPDEAVAQTTRAVVVAREARTAEGEASALDLHARALLASGDTAAAADAWQQCAAIHRDRSDAQRLALVEHRLAQLAAMPAGIPAARDGAQQSWVQETN